MTPTVQISRHACDYPGNLRARFSVPRTVEDGSERSRIHVINGDSGKDAGDLPRRKQP